MKKLKKNFNSFIIKCKTKIKVLFYLWIQKPYLDKKEALQKEREVKLIHKEFRNKFGVDPSEISKLIKAIEPKTKPVDLKAERLESVKQFNNNRLAPFHYNPEICDIHNENPDRMSYPSFNEISREDSAITSKLLREQSNKPSTTELKLKSRVDFLWKTRN